MNYKIGNTTILLLAYLIYKQTIAWINAEPLEDAVVVMLICAIAIVDKIESKL